MKHNYQNMNRAWERLRQHKYVIFLFVALVPGFVFAAEPIIASDQKAQATSQNTKTETPPKNNLAKKVKEKKRFTNGIHVTVQQTSLHWMARSTLLVRGLNSGAITHHGSHLFNATNTGTFGWYDPSVQKVKWLGSFPSNYQGLTEDGIVSLEGFVSRNFRATGVAVEQKDDLLWAYVSHHVYKDQNFYFRLSKAALSFDGQTYALAEDWTPLATIGPVYLRSGTPESFQGQKSGGRVLIYDDERILWSVGDFDQENMDLPDHSHDPDSYFGKMLFVNKKDGSIDMAAIGTRNTQGLFRDGQDRIWFTEHGPAGGDELNLFVPDTDYGWPRETLGLQYGLRPWPYADHQGRHDVYAAPVYAWVPSIGISNGVSVNGNQFPLWKDDLLISTLGRRRLYRLRMHEGHVQYSEPIEMGQITRDLTILESGHIVIIRHNMLEILSDAGALYETQKTRDEIIADLHDAGLLNKERFKNNSPPEVAVAETPVDGRALYEENCASCHSLNGGIEVSVPLNGIVGRQIGSLEGYGYSAPVSQDKRIWSADLLRSFIASPNQMYPATTMPSVNLNTDEIKALVSYLAKQE